MKHSWLFVACIFLCIICSGCGQTFRPIIIPNPPQFPNPAASHSVISISDNGTVVDGSAMAIDVSGDSIVSIDNAGIRPVHAVMATADLMLVANQSAGTGLDSVTKYTFSGTSISSATTVTLPTGSAPNFVASAPGDTKAYISLPGQSSVGILTESTNAVTPITVGANPVSIAVTPDTTKLYVANYGAGTISAFNTVDRSTRGLSAQPSSPPIWLSARTDSQQVYVLEQNGVLGYITISSTAGPDTFTEVPTQTLQVPTAAYMWYDVILNRLYIPGRPIVNGTGVVGVAIVDVSQSAPTPLADVSVTALAPSTRLQGDPCASTTQPGGNPLIVDSVTSLPDGSRVYVGSYYIDSADNVCPQVTVINTSTNTVSTATPVPGFPDATNPSLDSGIYYVPVCANTRDLVGPMGNGFRITMAAGGDSSRAYLASCDGGNVNIIYTSNDTYAETAPAPASTRSPIFPSTQAPPQNPLFLIAGP